MAAPTIVTGILTGGSNNHTSSSEEVNAVATDFVSEGIIGSFTNTSGVAPATGAFACNATATPDANINISTGVAYVTATPTSQNSQTLRVRCSVTGTLAISSNVSGSTKYDWIYISVSATNAANPAVGADNVATIVASRSSSASTDDGTPPTYGYPIAVVTVANGFSTITNSTIRDVRGYAGFNTSASSASTGWNDLSLTPNTVTYNGNRSYSLVYNSTDLTSTLSAGMRNKFTRLVTAPTQCTDLETSSSQYYSRSSPTGISFTTTFTCSAWVKLESYNLGCIISRRSGNTEGWSLYVNASGQLELGAYRIAANNKVGLSSQSLPLGKWVHVAASMDVSVAGDASTVMYFDGVVVPSTVTTTGTCTALVQGTTALAVGAQNTPGNYFDGKLAQVAVFSSVLTAATIRSYASQGLSGSESTLVCAYSFNGVVTDLSANANTLTANNAAVATNADSPFSGGATGTTDYGIVTGVSFSTNSTVSVQVPEGYTIPTSGGVSAVAYSSQKAPLNFPVQRGKWLLASIQIVQLTQASAASGTWYNPGSHQLSIPVGEWFGGYQNSSGIANGSGSVVLHNSLSTSASSESNIEYTTESYFGSTQTWFTPRYRTSSISATVATPYYLIGRYTGASTATLYALETASPAIIFMECAYL